MITSSSILPGRWVDEVVKGAVDLDDIRARLRATMNLITRHRKVTPSHEVITLAAERANDALDALRNQQAALLH